MPYELVKASSNEYTTRSHDSLRMSNGLWNWCSRGFCGKNAIDFIQKTENMSFNDAANYVLEKMKMQTPKFVIQEKISDFKLDENKFIIYGKGDKERTGYLNAAAKKALEKYLEVREKIIPKSKKDKDALFINQRGERIKSRGIELMVKKSYNKAGLNSKKYGVHTLRHTCATILYRIGVDIKIIQEILGHVQVDTTEIYTHLFDKDVMADMMSDAMSFALEH